jgi:hypothetical protein
MTLDIKETFVLDAVSHAYNLDAANVLDERYAQGIGEMLFGMLDQGMPQSHRITHDSFFRDWSIEEVATLLFAESDTDVATFPPDPRRAVRERTGRTPQGQTDHREIS